MTCSACRHPTVFHVSELNFWIDLQHTQTLNVLMYLHLAPKDTQVSLGKIDQSH